MLGTVQGVQCCRENPFEATDAPLEMIASHFVALSDGEGFLVMVHVFKAGIACEIKAAGRRALVRPPQGWRFG